jgi:hypothetical protein
VVAPPIFSYIINQDGELCIRATMSDYLSTTSLERALESNLSMHGISRQISQIQIYDKYNVQITSKAR